MYSHGPIKLAFGGGAFGFSITEPKPAQELLDVLSSLNVDIIDTAKIYGESEALLGKLSAGKKFTIDTKHPGGIMPGTATDEGVVEEGLASLKRLNLDKVDIYYIHGPDKTVPLESTLKGINELYKKGAFQRFGISNYAPSEVEGLYDICKKNGYVLPTVYQGNYNAVARKYDEALFPTLRKLGISFYAYSPSAGGFLSKTKQQILDGVGRFKEGTHLGDMYSKLYKRPTLLDALTEWAEIAKTEGVTPTELAYRWLVYNAILSPEHGDAMIFGSRTKEQLKETVGWVKKGPLSETACRKIDDVWEKVKAEAPLDNLSVMGG